MKGPRRDGVTQHIAWFSQRKATLSSTGLHGPSGWRDATLRRIIFVLHWDMREHFIEGRTHLENLLQLIESGYVKERGRICTFLGALATSQGDFESADAFLKQSLALYGELDDQWGIAASLNALAITTRDRGNFEEAESYFEMSLACWRKLPDPISTARCLHNLANAAKMRSDFPRATTALAEAISIFRELGDTSGAAWSINQSGDLELEQDRIESAHDLGNDAPASVTAIPASLARATVRRAVPGNTSRLMK